MYQAEDYQRLNSQGLISLQVTTDSNVPRLGMAYSHSFTYGI